MEMQALRRMFGWSVAMSAALCIMAAQPCAANDWTVATTADDGTANTLRSALASALDGDTINITATGTIALTSGYLDVDKSVIITGPGQDQLTVDGQGTSSVFVVWHDKIVTISGLTIANGATPVYGGGVV